MSRRCRRPCQTAGDRPVGLYQTETWHHRAGGPDRGYGPLPCLHSRMGKGLPWPTLSSCGSARLSC
jgi:hypothetical protein